MSQESTSKKNEGICQQKTYNGTRNGTRKHGMAHDNLFKYGSSASGLLRQSCSDHGHDQLCDLENISSLTLSFLKYKMGEHTYCVEAWVHLWHTRERSSKSTTVHAYIVTWLLQGPLLPWAHMEAHTKFPEVSCWVGHLILLCCSLPWCYLQRFWIFVT